MTKKNPHITSIDRKRAAGCLLALAVKDLFPKILLGKSGATSTGFYADFCTDIIFTPAILQQVEERMVQAIHYKGEVQSKEMVPVAASGYFSTYKEPYLARCALEVEDQTVFLLNIQGKMLPVEAEVKIKDLGVVGEIRVHAVEEMAVAPRRVRIYGAVFESKEEKKEFAKNKAGVIPSSHVVIGRQRKWYEEIDEGRWIWYPSGYKIRSILLHFFEKMASEEGFSWMSIERDCQYFSLDKSFSLHKSVAVRCAQEIVSECVITSEPESKTFSSGLLDTYFKHKHISHIFCEKGNLLEKTISCLHFVTKIFKILGFAFQIVLVGKQKRGVFEAEVLVDALAKSGVAFTTENVLNQPLSIEWRIQDKMGIYWPVSAIYCPRKCNLKQQEYAVLPFSLFLSIERVLALLIESTKGKLPSFLAPYQVTVLVVREKHVEYAKDVVLQLTLAGVRAQIILKGELKANLHQACIEGVPYIAVVGDKEVANRTIALRVEEGAPPLCVTLDELVKMCNHGCKQE